MYDVQRLLSFPLRTGACDAQKHEYCNYRGTKTQILHLEESKDTSYITSEKKIKTEIGHNLNAPSG